MTGPMWIGWTRPKVMRVIGVLNKVPIVSIAGEFVEGYLPLADEYFYCKLVEIEVQKADRRFVMNI